MTIRKTNRLPQVRKQLEALGSRTVQVGIMGDGEPRAEDLSNAEVGAVHEFGSSDGRIPARSWLSRSVNEKQADYVNALSKLVTQAIEKGISPERALVQLGLKAEADIKNFLRAGKATPPLANSTIAHKGSTTPLIDSGQLVNSITSRVVDTNSQEDE